MAMAGLSEGLGPLRMILQRRSPWHYTAICDTRAGNVDEVGENMPLGREGEAGVTRPPGRPGQESTFSILISGIGMPSNSRSTRWITSYPNRS